MDLRTQLEQHLGSAFVLGRELGGGGMSRVFVADELRFGRKVAIKVLSPELAQGLNAERFEREILLVASLQQANIVPVLAAGDVGGLPYFTMPFVEGESLRSRLGSGGLPIADVIAILRDVARALAYAHARGVVHRDIKPDNVLLSGETAVVTDFGIAKALSASRADAGGNATLTSVGTSIGTPAYMAPEQVAGDPDIDHRVDLYSLGCMAMELLTGRAPFANLTPQRTLAAHLSEAPPTVESQRGDCPPALSRLVARLLQKDPTDRVQSAQEVLRALDDASTASAPTMSLSAPGMLPKALLFYVLATVAVAIVAKAAVVGIGLPEWTFPGAMLVMLLGLPALLFTAYVKRVARRAATATPTLTPNGTMVGRPPSGTMATIALKANRHVSWRRTLRAGVVAMTAFVLLVVAFMVTRSMGIGPAASLFAAGTLQAQDRILIADLTAAPDDSSLAAIVEEAVRAAMSQSRAVQLLTPGDVAGALGEMQRADDTPLDATVATEVAARTGAKAILGGRLARAGSGYAISLELSDAAQGTPLASVQGTTDGQKDLLEVVDEMTRKLRGKLGESLKQVQQSVPLERATTSSLLALRKYSDASRANDIEGDYDKAVTLLREAVAIDSTFALAWRKLNAALNNSGGPQVARDSALERAARYADRLPPLEKHLVLGAFNQAHSTLGDRGKALAAYQAIIALDSSHTVALNQLAILHTARESDDSALLYTQRQFRGEPTPRNAVKLMSGLMANNRVDDAQRIADSVIGENPGALSFGAVLDALSGIQYLKGNIDSTIALLEAARALPAIPDQIAGTGALIDIASTHGSLRQFERLVDTIDALLETRGSPSKLDGYAAASADIVFRGRPAEGVAALDRIVAGPQWKAIPVVDRPWLITAVLYAYGEAPAKGRALMARRLAEQPGLASSINARPTVAWVEGELALAEGKYAEAITRFRAAGVGSDGAPSGIRHYGWYGIARAFDRQQQVDSARMYFEKYLAVPVARRWSRYGDPLALAMVNKRLGEIYDGRNDRVNALRYYEAFAKQWDKADAELQPTVTTVRKRIEELKRAGG